MFYILLQMKYIVAISLKPNRCVYVLLSGKLKEEKINLVCVRETCASVLLLSRSEI